MVEIICPKCGDKLMIETWEDGKCPTCGGTYFWHVVLKSGFKEISLHWHRH